MMNLILLFLGNLLFFMFGRIVGRVESELNFPHKVARLVESVKKVEELCSLKGQKISELSDQELIRRVQEQLKLRDNP